MDTPSTCAFVHPAGKDGAVVTTWGEMCRTRVTAEQTGGRLAVLDYRAPAGFGPDRHVHINDDEIFIVQQGTIAVWTSEISRTAKPGELVFLPRGVAHTWRSYGESDVHLQVIVTPGQFENFFPPLVERRLTLADQDEMAKVAAGVGVEFLGPPLSDEDVAAILRGAQP